MLLSYYLFSRQKTLTAISWTVVSPSYGKLFTTGTIFSGISQILFLCYLFITKGEALLIPVIIHLVGSFMLLTATIFNVAKHTRLHNSLILPYFITIPIGMISFGLALNSIIFVSLAAISTLGSLLLWFQFKRLVYAENLAIVASSFYVLLIYSNL